MQQGQQEILEYYDCSGLDIETSDPLLEKKREEETILK